MGWRALGVLDPDPPVREMLSVNFEGWVRHVKGCLDKAKARLPAGTDTHALATFVLTTMEGGVMQSRTHRTLAAFDASVAGLRDYFTLLQAAAGTAAAPAAHQETGT